MFDAHANFAISAVAVAPSPATSGLSLTVVDASDFPAAPFNALIWPSGVFPLSTNAEIVRVSVKVGNVLTLSARAQEGTSARTVLIGDQIQVGITAKTFTDIEAAIGGGLTVSAGASSAAVSALTFSNSNGVSFGLSDSVITATVATNYQSQGAYLTTAGLSQDSSKYAGTNGAITGGSITVNTSGVSVNLPAYLTTAMQSNAVTLSNVKVSAGASSAFLSALTFSNSNGLAFGLDGSTITGSYTVPTLTAGSDTAGISNLGNTSGTSGVISGDAIRLILAGGNNITLSQSINGSAATITISGANAGGAQTGLSGLSAGGALVTSGTVVFADSNGVSFGLDGNTLTATVRTDYQSAGAYLTTAMQSNAVTLSNIKISAGTLSQFRSAVSFNDSNGVSFGLETNGIITATVQTNYLTTAMASDRGSDFVQATAAFAGTSASGTIASDGISISIGPYITTADLSQNSSKYAQAWELTGNTAGTTSSLQGTKLYFDGGNNITVSGNSNTIKLSVGAYLTTAMASNRGSDFVQATAVFNGTNATGTIASGAISVSVAAQSNQTVGLYASSNTYLTSSGTVDGRSLSFRGDKSITIGVSSGEVVFSVGAYLTTAGLSADSSKYAGTNGAITGGSITVNTSGVSVNLPAYLTTAALSGDTSKYVQEWALTGNTAGTTSSAQGTRLYFSGGNSLTISGSSNSIVFSVGNYLTTAMASNRGSDFVQATAAFAGTNATGTIASGGISVNVAAPIPIATAVKAVGSAGSTGTITRYAPEDHQHAGVAGIGISTSGNTAGTTGSQVGTYWFQGGNSITVSQITSNNGSHTLVLSVGNYLTTAMASNRGSDFVQATAAFAGTNANGTIASDGISVSVAAQSNQSAIKGFGVSNTGATAGNTGISTGIDWVLAGSNLLTLSQSTAVGGPNTVWMQHPAWLTTADLSANSSKYVQNWKLTGNTAGTTSSANGTDLWFSGGNSLTISGSGQSLVFSVGAYLTTARASSDAVGLNTAQTNVTWTINSSGFSLNAGGYAGTVTGATGASVTANTSGVSVNVPLPVTLSMWPDVLPGSTAVSTYYSGSTSQGAGGASTQTGYTFSLYVVPLPLPAAVAFSELRIGFSNTRSAAGTGSVTHLCSIGFYTNNASTLSLVKGYYGGLGFTQNSVTSNIYRLFTLSTGSNSVVASGGYGGLRSDGTIYSSAGNITANSQLDNTNAPVKFMRVDNGVATTLSGGQYYCVLGFASASASSNVYGNAGIIQSNAISSIHIPDLGREASTETSNYIPAWGAISTTFTSVSNAVGWFPLPNAINIANITMSNSSGQRFHFPLMRNHS